jgi:hypothetical protein
VTARLAKSSAKPARVKGSSRAQKRAERTRAYDTCMPLPTDGWRARVNASLLAARFNYRVVFARAYRTLNALDRDNPVARSIVQFVYFAPDPGEALMQWYRSLRGGKVPAYMGGRKPQGRRRFRPHCGVRQDKLAKDRRCKSFTG